MIYDACILFNEVDMLDARLNILDGVVDRFVIVEADTTFSGQPKPLHLLRNWELFAPFHSKITPIFVHDMPQTDNRRERLTHQRNAIRRGPQLASGGDLILISDVDEIPHPEQVKQLNPNELTAFGMKTYYYNLETVIECPLIGTVAVPYSRLQSPDAHRLDAQQKGTYDHYVEGCWHFSYFGGVGQMQHKISSFGHAEYDTPYWNDGERLADRVKRGVDLFDRNYALRHEPANDSLPRYILDNRERFSEWFME